MLQVKQGAAEKKINTYLKYEETFRQSIDLIVFQVVENHVYQLLEEQEDLQKVEIPVGNIISPS